MSRDFLNSWRDRVKQRNSHNAELKALQEELDRTTAEIESKINVEMDEDIHSLFSMLGQSAAEAQTEIVQRLEYVEFQREEEIKTIVESDKQAETLFNFLGEESSNFLSEPIEEPKMEMSEEVEDFLGTLGGVDVFVEPEPIEEEIEPEQEILIDSPTQEVVEEIMGEMVEVLAEPVEPKDVISAAAEWMDQLDEIKKEPALDDLGKLTKQVELIQNQLSTYKVGWGQEGMTYGSGEVRLEYLDDVDDTTAKTDGYYLQYQASTNKWIGSVSTTGGWDPSGYEYTGDKLLDLIVNEPGSINGLEILEDTWTQMPSGRGSSDDYLPSNFENRIWDDSVNRFYFAELPVDAVVLFRVQVWVYPETNNALIKGRIRFVAVGDGTDAILNEDGDRIVLEDDTGNILADYLQAYSFFQTVAAQEMNDGAGNEHERTFLFPIYVGNSSAQRGWGRFELNCSCDFTLNDSSVVAVLN